jgi:hypothetical protein
MGQAQAVLNVGDVGWSDLGTPERVRAAMARCGLKPEWQESVENENSKALVNSSAR